MDSITVDFVAKGAGSEPWELVLVEQGPWQHYEIDARLRALQHRLYGCLDAAIDGELARMFPESDGRRIRIRVDGYDLPVLEVRGFFERFAEGALKQPSYASSLSTTSAVAGIEFQLCLSSTPTASAAPNWTR